MTVELRGMVEWLLEPLIKHLAELPELPAHIVACTDDLFALTLLEDGGMDHLIKRLIAGGMAPLRAYRLATYHAAIRLGCPDLGLVAAGRRADLVILSDLEGVIVDEVFFEGQLVAKDGAMCAPVVEGPSSPPYNTMHLDPVAPDDFLYRLPGEPDGEVRLRVIHGAVQTTWGEATVEVRDEIVQIPDGHLLQVAIHRHGRAPATPVAALTSGWGDWTGAIATTFTHDTHNLVVFGRDTDDMAIAANAVIAAGGGVAVVTGGEVIGLIELPIAGILSPLPPAELAEVQRRTQDAAISVGLTSSVVTQPLLQVMVSSLACLGGPHVTDIGVVDGTTGKRVPDLVVR